VLLAALVQTLSAWIGGRTLLVDWVLHGREAVSDAIDLSRTVGWFTAVFPALLDLRDAGDPEHALLAVREQLRRIPNRGSSYEWLRYVSADATIAERLAALPRPQVSFNYQSQ